MKNIKKDIFPKNHSSYKILCKKFLFSYIQQIHRRIKTIPFLTRRCPFFNTTGFFQDSQKTAENQHKQQQNTKIMMVRVKMPNRICLTKVRKRCKNCS